jgi:hypothetical protein
MIAVRENIVVDSVDDMMGVTSTSFPNKGFNVEDCHRRKIVT